MSVWLPACKTSLKLYLIYQGAYLFKWIAWEFFFRGFWQIGLSRRLGPMAYEEKWVLVIFALTALLWLILLGWIIHLWSIIDAAVFRPPEPHWRERYRDRYYYRA